MAPRYKTPFWHGGACAAKRGAAKAPWLRLAPTRSRCYRQRARYMPLRFALALAASCGWFSLRRFSSPVDVCCRAACITRGLPYNAVRYTRFGSLDKTPRA